LAAAVVLQPAIIRNQVEAEVASRPQETQVAGGSKTVDAAAWSTASMRYFPYSAALEAEAVTASSQAVRFVRETSVAVAVAVAEVPCWSSATAR
jgi:hypothetical protein